MRVIVIAAAVLGCLSGPCSACDSETERGQAVCHTLAELEELSIAIGVGDSITQACSVMSFITTDEITLIGMFSPNGFQTIKPGAPVKLVFDNDPGRIHEAAYHE
jgi:hypothetical protein